MRCPNCHGTGVHADSADGRWVCVHCDECKGSGVIHCCEGLTQGVTEMATLLTRVDYDDAPEPGWYIYQYDTAEDMLAKRPMNTLGPYSTQAEATRLVADMTSQMIINYSSKRQPHDPVSDQAPAFDAGIPTDNEIDAD